MPVLLQVSFKCLGLLVANLDRANGTIIGFLEFDGAVPNIFTWFDVSEEDRLDKWAHRPFPSMP